MSLSIESTDGNVLARFEKNSKEEVRVSVDTFHGRQIINLRVFYRDGEEWKHGKQGIALSVDRFKDLADAVLQVGAYLKTHGIL
ncbi:MAG TPA: transcriptional coactivator p15/PC4 family protein [Opitutaceae bacterium]|jgi:hypothetical protein